MPQADYEDEDEDEDDGPGEVRGRSIRKPIDPVEGLIPYRNPKALAAYYCGVFALIPCVGLVLGPIALILGILGLKYANANPTARGKGHALTGIILGGLVIVANYGVVILMIAGGIMGGR